MFVGFRETPYGLPSTPPSTPRGRTRRKPGCYPPQAMMGAVNRDPTGQGPLFCLPPNTNFSGKIVLEAAKRVTETAKGEDIFERELLSTLTKMFPCESRPELK